MKTRTGIRLVGGGEFTIPTIQQIVRSGEAEYYFKLKDQISCYHEQFGNLVWDIIGFDHEVPSDSKYTHSMTLLLHNSLEGNKVWDSGGTNHSNGYNRWAAPCDIKQWLNSKQPGGKWWKANSDIVGDKTPPYSDEDGFLCGLDPAFTSALGFVKKKTARNIADGGGLDETDERIFLLSYTELGGGNNNELAEGEAYSVFSDNSSRVKTDSSGTTVYWWTRSAFPSTTYSVRRVDTPGSFINFYAYTTTEVVPACVII